MTHLVNQSVELAVALHYDGENTPRVTAKGRDHVAAQILEIAAANDITLQHDAALAGVLCQIPLGDEIVAVVSLLRSAKRPFSRDDVRQLGESLAGGNSCLISPGPGFSFFSFPSWRWHGGSSSAPQR